MNAREAIRASMAVPDVIVQSYLDDLSDDDLMIRTVDGLNHIKWQLGHLVSSENGMIESVCPGSMPPLPEGFKEKYTKETASIDDPAAFHSKDEYLKLAAEQREAMLKALDGLSDDDLDKPAPERLQRMWPTVGSVFSMQPTHWVMHAGQWAVLRRKLGKPPLF